MYMYLGYTRWPIASWILTEATKQLYTLQLYLIFCLVVLAANFSEKPQQFFINPGYAHKYEDYYIQNMNHENTKKCPSKHK